MSHFETDGKTTGRSCRSMNQQEAEKTNGFPGGENREQASIRVYHRCGGCGKKLEFLNSGKFRVNANGSSVDVWLIYRCKKCKHSWNLTVYERTKPSKIPRAIFEAFQENDGELAAAFGRSIDFLKKNRAEFK